MGRKDPTEFRDRFLRWKNGENPYSAGRIVDAIYKNNPKEEFLGEPSHNYDFTQSEEWANAHGYYPDERGHRDDKVKKPAHPSHPSRGTWDGDKFVLTDKGMLDPNYTLFGLNDGGLDPQAILTHKGSTVLPEMTVTPKGNYIYNSYDNIKLHLPKHANGKLPGYEDGNVPNLFQRPDKSYFFLNGDQLVDVTPLMTSLSDDPSTWTYVDNSGKLYTPKQNKPTQGEIIQDDRSSGEKFWDQYVGELKYDINNDRVVGGKYTLPAIGLGALGLYAAGAAGSSAAMPALNEAVGLVGKNIWGNAARNFALSMLTGEVVNEATKLATGYSWGQNISAGTGGWIPEAMGDFTNPGYLFSGESGNFAYNSAKEAIRNFPKQIRYLKKLITAENRARTLSEKLLEFYGPKQTFYKQNQKDIGARYNDTQNKLYQITDDYNKAHDEYKRDIESTITGNAEFNFENVESTLNTLLKKLTIDPKLKAGFLLIAQHKNLPEKLIQKIKDSNAAEKMATILDKDYFKFPDFSKMSGADIVKFINKNAPNKLKINLTKGNAENITSIPGLESFINMDIGGGAIKDDGEIALRMLLQNGGYTVTPSGNILSQKGIIPFNQIFKTGNFSIPKFGTNQTVEGVLSVNNPGTNIEINPFDIIRSISDKKITPRSIDHGAMQYSAQIPEQLKDVLLHNIEYLKEMFPGAKPFGSSTTSAYAGTPHVTHDIDLLLSDTDFVSQVEKKLGGRTGSGWSVSSKPNNTGFEDTYTHSLGLQYGDAGNIDFNIIYTDPDTGMASSQMGTRGLELFKQFFPADYRTAMLESMRTGNPIKINKTPKELIDAYDPTTKTILDSFSSNKAKHVPRAEAHLTTTDPQYVSKALDLYAQEKLGGLAQRIPTTREMFTDVEQNRRIFDDLGYKGVDKETVINDPDKMKNLVDYWYYHNSIFGRGVDTTRLIQNGLDKMDILDKSFRLWYGTGGNANGPGLNTVTLGDSGYGNVYGYIQPKLKFDNSQSAEELILSAKRQLGHYSYRFTDAEKLSIEEILKKYGLSISNRSVNTPEDLLRAMYTDTNSSKLALQEISDKLGIRALSKLSLYDQSGRYNSMTGDVTTEDALMYAPKASQEMPVSDVIRDRKTVQESSRDEAELKSEIEELSKERWIELRKILFDQNRLYRTRKELEPLRVGRKYEEMSRDDIEKLVNRKMRKENPELVEDKKLTEEALENIKQEGDSNFENLLSSERRFKKGEDLLWTADHIKRNKKLLLKIAATVGGIGIPIVGLVSYLDNDSRFNRRFVKSMEYSQFSKDTRLKNLSEDDFDGYMKIMEEYKNKYKARIKQERLRKRKK